MVEGQAWATAFQSYMFSCLLGMEVQWVNAPYKFWSVGKDNPLFLVMVELICFRKDIFNSDNFLRLERFFSIYFQPLWVQSPTSSCLLLLIFVIFFVIDFSFFFPAALSWISGIVFFIFVSLLLASHSFRLTICGWLCSFNSKQLRRRTLINSSPSSRHLSTGRRSNLCAKLCRHTGQVVLYKKGKCLYVRK